MNSGYIKLHRKLMDSRVFANEGLLKVWIWCLCKASYKTQWVPMKTGRGETVVQVNPGEFIFGRKQAADELGMKQTSVRDRMNKLEAMQNIARQPATHYTIVSIINWESYQSQEEIDAGQTANHPPGNRQATARQPPGNRHIQEGKEGKEGKEKKKTPAGQKKTADPRVKVFIDWWCAMYEKRFNKKYVVQGPKVAGIIKNLLRLNIGWEELQYAAILFMLDDETFIEEKGHDISMFLLKINKYKYSDPTLKGRYGKHLAQDPTKCEEEEQLKEDKT
jgi:hypothetical protein